MNVAFYYRRRRGGDADCAATIGSMIDLLEATDYLLTFTAACSPAIRGQITDIGGEMLTERTALLTFDNFVGEATLATVVLRVFSTKIGRDGSSRLLEEISELGSSLVFAAGSPLGLRSAPDTRTSAPVPYHQLQYLRKAMLGSAPGHRLQDWLFAVERNPTRQFERERPVVSVDRVRKLDHRAIASVFSRFDRLVPVSASSATATNRLAQALSFGSPKSPHFPSRVAAPYGRLTFDTPENRFVRHVVGLCLALVQRFAEHPRLHARLRMDCRKMLATLEHFASQPFIAQASVLSAFNGPSQALAKADGYREVFGFWREIESHVSLPQDSADAQRLLEGRDMAKLYEYWVFLKVVASTFSAFGSTPVDAPKITRDEFGESIAVGVPSIVGPQVTVRFNPSFNRTNDTAYSTPLRPDVVLQVGETLHALDAKYKLSRPETGTSTDDVGGTFLREDLYKMHTYRDAIKAMKTAFVVYPGTEFVFFDRKNGMTDRPLQIRDPDGVGAIPLQPGIHDTSAILQATIAQLIAGASP